MALVADCLAPPLLARGLRPSVRCLFVRALAALLRLALRRLL